jgi:hypothetical protein
MTLSTVLVIVFVGLVVGAILVWGLRRIHHARAAVRGALEQAGYQVVRMQRRTLRQGPFWKTTTNSQVVFRVLVRETAGRQRTVWVRWGRRWLPEPDEIEMLWEDR